MSIAGEGVAVVSIGISCEAAIQIRRHAALISRLCGAGLKADGGALQPSDFPFDWIIQHPLAFVDMARAGRFFPASPDEIENPVGETAPYCAPPSWEPEPPHLRKPPAHPWRETRAIWRANRTIFWHEFGDVGCRWDAYKAFADTAAKFDHTTRKFLGLSGRAVFVLQNSQCALESMASLSDLPVGLSRERVRAVLDALKALFPAMEPELIVVSRRDRIIGDLKGWPCQVYLIDPSGLSQSDTEGDADQWGDVFKHYFGGQARPGAEPVALLFDPARRMETPGISGAV